MTNIVGGLLNGMVIETTVESWTGDYLYSDFATGLGNKNTALNVWIKIPVLGIFGGITRMALAVIHTIGHLFAALVTWKRGHLFHAAKGVCEFLNGMIETTPIVGRIFANWYRSAPIYDPMDEGARTWWMIKIYNPTKPDGLDQWMDNWHRFPAAFYIRG